MAEYIIVDANGKELRREPKGRGRNRIGAVKLPDGNFQVTETPEPTPNTESKPEVKAETETPKTEENSEAESEPAPVGGTTNTPTEINANVSNVKTFKTAEQVSIKYLSSAIFTSPKDRIETDDSVEFLKVNVIKQLPIPLQFNSVLARVVADKKTGDITVWSDYPGPPKYKIEKALAL